jgi:CubicO group peptidase (beta-lactamase class C family)
MRALRATTWVLVVVVFFAFRSVAAESPAASMPITGTTVPALIAYDKAMIEYLTARQMPAAVLAVSRNGKIVLERGYGWSDEKRTVPTMPQTRMRIASVCKPITGAAIRKLIADGRLSLDTKAFELLAVEPSAGSTPDPRLKQITVGQLLDHRGGWDRAAGYDPMFHDREIQTALRLPLPPDASQIIRFMAGQPLNFDPGAKSVYSNFGYCVLGRVIEKVSGKSYVDYVQEEVAGPIGMKSLALARSTPKDRPADEAWYSGVDMDLHKERMDSHGGLISTAGDLCHFMGHYWINGVPRKPGDRSEHPSLFFGSLPGTSSMALERADGVDIAVIINARHLENDDPMPDLKALWAAMDAATESVKNWPE